MSLEDVKAKRRSDLDEKVKREWEETKSIAMGWIRPCLGSYVDQAEEILVISKDQVDVAFNGHEVIEVRRNTQVVINKTDGRRYSETHKFVFVVNGFPHTNFADALITAELPPSGPSLRERFQKFIKSFHV